MVLDVADVALATDLVVIIILASVLGFVASRWGQPTIIAYIIAGLLLGPAVFGLVEPGALTETMAELGLAFLLFLLGIKMRIEDIRDILSPILKISIPQMALVAAVGTATALALGFSLTAATIIGLAVMYSSTAVIIKMLTDKGTATTLHGKLDVGVLLVQDIAVVILLAILAAGQPDNLLEVATTLVAVLALVGAIGAAALLASRYVLPPIFRQIAGQTQTFFLISMSWLFLLLFVSASLELSIEMGAFLAGIAIAQMPYSKELQARVSPLTDLFILVFFVSVSLELALGDLLEFWQEAVIAAAVLMVAKCLIFLYLLDWQGFDIETTFLGSVNMVQVSEFGLIVGAVAVTQEFIEEGVLGFLTILALLTMALSVYVIKYNELLFERLRPTVAPWLSGASEQPASADYRDHVVVVGFDEIARRAILQLSANFEQIVVIDRQIGEVETIESAGFDAVFGDVKYEKIRHDAGVGTADFIFSSSVQTEINQILIDEAKPEATVFVEAELPEEAAELYERGADFVILTAQLSAEQLRQYLDIYLTDQDQFETAIQGDVRILHSDELFPTNRQGWGQIDD